VAHPAIVLAAIVLPQGIRILREYERGVVFRLANCIGRARRGRG